MSNILKIFILLFLIIFVINIFLNMMTDNSGNIINSGNVFIIREFDFPLEWKNEVEYAEVTKEELNQYPTLKKTINGENCTKYDNNLWRCKVDPDEWSITKNFINNKENVDTCTKIGENCYSIDFVICCTDNIEIESITPLCPCEDGANETMIITTIQNNQNLSTDMLTLSINIKNSSNITVSKIDSKTKFYVKDNSSLNSFTTMDIPGQGEYEINVQIFEKDKIIVQRSVYVNI